ncbi:uncharacterized protein [Rutidosis leptorrhynchoides]|uniref:uncharacterized protein n=1 Tax=Rutidosis leptorrhynchoides TaxID=125765 RepID=UPI003A994AEE
MSVDGFNDVVKNMVSSRGNNRSLHEKLKCLKSKIKILNNNRKSQDENRKKEIRDKLASIGTQIDQLSATTAQIEERCNLFHKLECISKTEEMDIVQKTWVNWSVEGDENSKLFHSLLKHHRNNHTIKGVPVNGIWDDNLSNVKQAFYEFFRCKFATSIRSHPVEVPNPVFTLNETNQRIMDCKITMEEITETVLNCESSKAAGPERF